uniref:AlNc14C226G9220 protein n=1 Tax=Albugo laibachii Nc14 TaxID=890382 RepID=F0WS82_9STRA|nr:AlNc14C226G9220 [Albugo laibachii Nc14]|eukprot:CCA24200.1 AlNc14C226G9220 [Albugo laibachii Nc14]
MRVYLHPHHELIVRYYEKPAVFLLRCGARDTHIRVLVDSWLDVRDIRLHCDRTAHQVRKEIVYPLRCMHVVYTTNSDISPSACEACVEWKFPDSLGQVTSHGFCNYERKTSKHSRLIKLRNEATDYIVADMCRECASVIEVPYVFCLMHTDE